MDRDVSTAFWDSFCLIPHSVAFSWSSIVWARMWVFRAVADSLNLSIRVYVESNENCYPLILIKPTVIDTGHLDTIRNVSKMSMPLENVDHMIGSNVI